MDKESVDTLRIFDELSPTLGEESARKLATLLGSMYVELRDVVRREDFTDLHGLVSDLAETQRGTEASVKQLSRAQNRTEARLEQLAEAQGRTEARLEQLAEAQGRTEARLEQLAEAQGRTEARLEQLAEAQGRTEAAILHNSARIDLMNKQYGGLSDSMGYTLENEAYRSLPALLKDDFDVTVEGTLSRDYLSDIDGKDMEVNILGDGIREGENRLIVGECKTQLSKNNVDSFLRRRLRKLDTGNRKIFPIMVAHMVSQKDVVDYARSKGVTVYLSYQFHRSN
jgi:hypothetical protein